jgi:hypothetical protein
MSDNWKNFLTEQELRSYSSGEASMAELRKHMRVIYNRANQRRHRARRKRDNPPA